jgi:CheY-like chemotaxis protein
LNPRTLAVHVADANTFSRGLLGEILRNLGVSNISSARSAEMAASSVRERPVDLILLSWDEHDPLDPLAFVRTLRSADEDRIRRLPVVLVTGSLTRQLVLAGRDAGVDEFLTKPISPAALRQRLEMVIETPRPFIESSVYVGPCRRRKNPADYHGAKRRSGESARPALIDQDELARETPMRLLLTGLRTACTGLDPRNPAAVAAATAQLQSAKALAIAQKDRALHAGLAAFDAHITAAATLGHVDAAALASMLAALEQLAALPQDFTEARESVAASLGRAIQKKQVA